MPEDMVIHREHEHPARSGGYRWFMAESGMVYWLQWHGPGYGWELFTHTGGTVIDGLMTLEDVRQWVRDGEIPVD